MRIRLFALFSARAHHQRSEDILTRIYLRQSFFFFPENRWHHARSLLLSRLCKERIISLTGGDDKVTR